MFKFSSFFKGKKEAKPDTWVNPVPDELRDGVYPIIRVPEEVLASERKARVEAALKAKEVREKELHRLACEKAEKGSGEYIFLILPQYRKLFYESKLAFEDWGEGSLDVLQEWGYVKQRCTSILGRGKSIVWCYKTLINRSGEVEVPNNRRGLPFKKDAAKDERLKVLRDKIPNQTTDHYFSVYQIASSLIFFGFQDVAVSHRLNADVTGFYRGKTYGFSYERAKTRSVDGLKLQYEKELQEVDELIYIVPFDAYNHACQAIDSSKVIKRGSSFLDYLNGL